MGVKRTRWLGIAGLLLGVLICSQAPASSSFYQGKTLTIIVPYSTGGGHDTIARLLSDHMKTYLGLASVHVVNKPGGGGLVGNNAVYNASADGLTIGVINTGGVFAQILDDPGVDFDMRRYTIFGAPDLSPHVFLSHPDSDYRTFDDVLGTRKRLTILATGKGGAGYELADIIFNAFDIPHKMVAGFKGKHGESAAFISGLGDIESTAPHNVLEMGSHVRPLMMASNTAYPGLSDVPIMPHYIEQEHITGERKALLQALDDTMFTDVLVVGPPGVPTDRTQALAAALEKTVNDPEYAAAAHNNHNIPRYTSGAKMHKAMSDLFEHGEFIRKLAEE